MDHFSTRRLLTERRVADDWRIPSLYSIFIFHLDIASLYSSFKFHLQIPSLNSIFKFHLQIPSSNSILIFHLYIPSLDISFLHSILISHLDIPQGDVLLMIDGSNVEGKRPSGISHLLLGPSGTHIEITVLCKKTGKKKPVKLVRGSQAQAGVGMKVCPIWSSVSP